MDHGRHVQTEISERVDLDRRIEQYRQLILDSLDGLSDEQAREVVVPGRPSILGVVRHTAFVEAVWFGEAITGRSRAEWGVPVATANSWKVRKADGIASVTAHCRRIHAQSRAELAGRDLADVVTGRGSRTVRSLCLHVLSELAWNTGQLDVLRAVVTTR